MTDTTHAPERIWVDFYPRDWPTERIIYGEMPEPYVKYIREDISDARVAAAYEAAADVLLDRGTNVEDPIAVRKDILSLTPDDAQAVLDRLIAEARYAHRELMEELSNCVAVLEAKLSKSEALLAKAVGALEQVQAFVRDLEPYADQGHTLVPALREACEILVELKQGAKGRSRDD